ncbi:MAG: sn-glycerol-3-phosphate ABC transporter ATP-binding protein UgpC [Firmicutes bacterium]|nr:sn-glycerol-3-phosphate ABC transporter ATP-binding protein UgpC [Bacillota bacterium]MCL5039818.1 sn-glycerol-3-phosphate ABC transporter ATP-binding protein UgpC [Bacillota bacterium]
MARVNLERVSKSFGEVAAVKDFNLEIQDKEFLVLVGPSGCGKSTTLRMVAGLEEITEGSIYIGDRLVNDVAPKDRDIAMVFQNYALYPHMNVYENMAFGLKLRRFPRSEIDRRVKEAAEILGIGELLRRKPKELSGGQRQRVALGRAIVREPKVFLMDEPLSNLDAKLRVQMRTELSKLHQRLQTTVIYVTHDQTEAMTMGDRIVVMKDGYIQQVATPQELYQNPVNMFVAGFIGSPPMNFSSCRITVDGSTVLLDGGSYKVTLPSEKARYLQDSGGREVVLGIRPEDIHVEGDFLGVHPDWSVPTTVEVVEPLGAETYLYLSSGKHSFMARVDAYLALHSGQPLKVALDLSHAHVFEKETEKAIF